MFEHVLCSFGAPLLNQARPEADEAVIDTLTDLLVTASRRLALPRCCVQGVGALTVYGVASQSIATNRSMAAGSEARVGTT